MLDTKNIIEKIIDGLSMMDKTAEIQRNKNGEIIPDPTTKDSEIVKYTKDIKEYMNEEVLPHIPDAMEFFEEDMNAKKPVIKTGAEIPFTRYFYKYVAPENSDDILERIRKNERSGKDSCPGTSNPWGFPSRGNVHVGYWPAGREPDS